MTDIGTSQARGLAADDVLFMQQITGDTGSGLQGYAPDAFLHFPGISRVRRSQRREGGAEDFSLTRGISAAELTHIDHERKRMTRYFKPLLAEVTKNQSFSHFLCHCITDSFLPIDIQLVLFVIYARFLYHYSITTLSQATWMENRHSAYTYLYISILQIKQTINT